MAFYSILWLEVNVIGLDQLKAGLLPKNELDNGASWKLEHINYEWRNDTNAFIQNICKYPIF